jgi:molybdopterin molybdotransferase
VRRAGEDIQGGEIVFGVGCVLGPAVLGVLASMDIPRPRVVRRPRVAIAIAGTGDEAHRPRRSAATGRDPGL